jgi:hypothetical protein
MMPPTRLWCLLLPLVALGGCATPEKSAVERSRTVRLAGFQAISYHRTGGAALTDDRLTIAEDGTLEASSRVFGRADGRLSEFEKLQLATLLEGLGGVADSYPSPRPSAAPAIIEIRVGRRLIRLAEDAEVPQELTLLHQRLVALWQRTLGRAKP